MTRYNASDTGRALKIPGFNVRDPEGSKVMYCIHGLTKDELWLPKVGEGVSEDVLADLLGLSIDFFRSVYMGLTDVNKYPPDQH